VKAADAGSNPVIHPLRYLLALGVDGVHAALIKQRCWVQFPECLLSVVGDGKVVEEPSLLGCSQAARPRTVNAYIVGSNPTAPALLECRSTAGQVALIHLI
jgi:hypothetical protein